MNIRFFWGRIAAHWLAAAILLAGACATADAQSLMPAPAMSEVNATLAGVVSVEELSASQANLNALRALGQARAVEQPVHPLPDGSLTSQPSRATLDALPTLEPNSAVFGDFAPSFASTKGFTGIYGGENETINGFGLEPPDQGLAVNNNVACEHNNLLLQFFNATTGAALTSPMADSAFFGTGSLTLTDTQCLFDPTTKRWFIDVVASNSTTNEFAVAVSQTSNALGKYWLYKINAFAPSSCGSSACFPDYPKAGYDANAFYITADLFSNSTGNFVESAIYVLPKSKLEAGAAFSYYRFDDTSDFVVQPSVPAPGEPFSTAANGSEFLMSAPGSSEVALIAIYNTNDVVSSGSSMLMRRITVKSQSYGTGTVPSTQPDVIGPYCKSVGATSAPQLDGGYSAFQATIQKASGNLYGALAFGSKDTTGFARDVLAWFELHPTLTTSSLSATIPHQGTVTPPNGYSISYPAMGLAKTGAGTMGMTVTNKSKSVTGGYPSAAFTQFTGTGTGSIVVSGPGNTSDDGFTGCPGAGPGKVGRWGDYGAATVDAVSGYFYTANEMIPNPTTYKRGTFENWGTFVSQMH